MEDKKKETTVVTSELVDESLNASDKNETYKVEMLDGSDTKTVKKQHGKVLALLSMIFAFIAFAGAMMNLLFGLLTIILSLIVGSIVPIVHILMCIAPLIFGILAIVFSRIVKKKGNTSKIMKLGYIFGLISTILLGLIIVLLLILFVLAFVFDVLSFIVSFVLAFVTSFLSSIISIITPILAILAPVFGSIATGVLGDIIHEILGSVMPYIIEYLVEWFESLVSGGIILPLLW